MDGSKRSSHGNAYFTGFGKAKRIVFFDTLLRASRPRRSKRCWRTSSATSSCSHVVKRIAWFAALSLAFLALLGLAGGAPWFYAGLGVPRALPSRCAAGVALILFLLVLPVFTFLLAPLSSLYSRRHEFEADAYAAAHASAGRAGRALVKLYEDNAATLTPDPLHSAFYDSHPPAAMRIARLAAAAGACRHPAAA